MFLRKIDSYLGEIQSTIVMDLMGLAQHHLDPGTPNPFFELSFRRVSIEYGGETGMLGGIYHMLTLSPTFRRYFREGWDAQAQLLGHPTWEQSRVLISEIRPQIPSTFCTRLAFRLYDKLSS